MTDQTITRRRLVGAAAVIAAASAAVAALPAAAQVAPSPELKQPATSKRDAWDQLTATLDAEQHALLHTLIDEHGYGWMDEQRALVDELKRHAPPFAAMIQLTYEHVIDQRIEMRGVCCTPADTSPRYV
jgi:hypothetical protein